MTNVAGYKGKRQAASASLKQFLNNKGQAVLDKRPHLVVENEPFITPDNVFLALFIVMAALFMGWGLSVVGGMDYDTAQMTESYIQQTITGKSERQMALDSAAYYGY